MLRIIILLILATFALQSWAQSDKPGAVAGKSLVLRIESKQGNLVVGLIKATNEAYVGDLKLFIGDPELFEPAFALAELDSVAESKERLTLKILLRKQQLIEVKFLKTQTNGELKLTYVAADTNNGLDSNDLGEIIKVSLLEISPNFSPVLQPRELSDSYAAGFYINLRQPISSGRILTDWGFYAEPETRGRSVTPILWELDDAGVLVAIALGTPRISQGGLQHFPFKPVTGTNETRKISFLGWYDGSDGGKSIGSIAFDTGTGMFGTIFCYACSVKPETGARFPLAAGFTGIESGNQMWGWQDPRRGQREYSIEAISVPIPKMPIELSPVAPYQDVSGNPTASVAPGELVSLKVNNDGDLGFVRGTITNGSLDRSVGGASVTFNGIDAAIAERQDGIIRVIVPAELKPTASALVDISYAGNRAVAQGRINVVATKPVLFADQAQPGSLFCLNFDGSRNSEQSPATPGSAVIIFATGLGPSGPMPGSPDEIAPRPNAVPEAANLHLTINGDRAAVIYAGSSPGQPNTLVQINFRIPQDARPGKSLMKVIVGGVTSANEIYMYVGN